MNDTPRGPGRSAPSTTREVIRVSDLLRGMAPAAAADPWTDLTALLLRAADRLAAYQLSATTVLSRSEDLGHHVVAAALKALHPDLRWTADVTGAPEPGDRVSPAVAADDLFQVVTTGLVAQGYQGDDVPDGLDDFTALLVSTMADDVVGGGVEPGIKVLVASVSPPHSDVTGTPLRRAAVIRALRDAGFAVEQVAVVPSGAAPIPDPSLRTFGIPRSAYQESLAQHHGAIGPHLRGLEAAQDPQLVAGIRTLLETSRPDVVLFEQSFMFSPFAAALDELSYRPAVIYDAHNVEWRTADTALAGGGATRDEVDRHVGAVRAIEQALIDRADVVLAVSDQDAADFRDLMSAERVVLVPNGIARRPEERSNTRRLRDQLTARGVRQAAFFVGADWSPNVVGYLEMMGTDTDWLPEDSLVMVAGGACRGIQERAHGAHPDPEASFWRHTALLGRVSDADLASLLTLTDVVLLPITSGGGSNLKTAEAILSGKRIVATTFAMRGYEELADLPQITIADTPEEFRAAVREALLSAPVALTPADIARAQAVLWDHRLPPMIRTITSLAAGPESPTPAAAPVEPVEPVEPLHRPESSVWVDVTDFETWSGHLTGITRVTYESLKRLVADQSLHARAFAFDRDSKRLVERDLDALVTRIATGQPPVHLATGQRTALIGPEDSVAVLGMMWNSPEYVSHLAALKRTVGFHLSVLVYDTIPVKLPHLFGGSLFDRYLSYLTTVLQLADVIACISESTERDVHEIATALDLSSPRTAVVTLGDSAQAEAASQQPSFVGDDEDFLLLVGTIEVRKNLALIQMTWKLAAERGVHLPRLIVVGSAGWLVNDLIRVISTDPALADRITFHSGVPDGELKWLYQHCLFTLYPSQYEGWGLPIAESLAYGKVCLPSRTSSMTEIAGDLLEYTSPFDPNELLGLVVKYLDPEYRALREMLIADHRPVRTWDDTYRGLVELMAPKVLDDISR